MVEHVVHGSSGSSRHHPRESTQPMGFPNPCRSQRPPSAPGHRRWPSIDLGHYGQAALSPLGILKHLNPLQEDRNTAMGIPKAQITTPASAAPKRKLFTLEGAILRCDAGTAVRPDATTPQRTRRGVAHRPTPPRLSYAASRMATKKPQIDLRS